MKEELWSWNEAVAKMKAAESWALELKAERDAALARAAAAEARAERLAVALRAVEWPYVSAQCDHICPSCSRLRDDGHADLCGLRAALAEEPSKP